MVACFLVAMDKAPGFHSVGIGDIIHHLLAKCVLLVTVAMKTEACGDLNLCAGLGYGIEVSEHTTLDEYSMYR